ncbi:zinc finger protein 761-like isoform X1 [Armigeres subalbatus]|uniref:zinc finger protein 761-like isoform X1 n=1 Tax=Armigeres subalbatus TaxID=124917 RepID=UPI002ED45333
MSSKPPINSNHDPVHIEPTIKAEPLSVDAVMAGPSAPTGPAVPNLKPIKTKMCIKKSDIHQCRLCLRVLPKNDVREISVRDTDLRDQIREAVAVNIVHADQLKSICLNCLVMVEIIQEFRMTCKKAEMLHSVKLMMMHPGQWMSQENKTTLETCHRLVKRNKAEMDGLFKCSGIAAGNIKEIKKKPKERVLPAGDDPETWKNTIVLSDSETSSEESDDKRRKVRPVVRQVKKADNDHFMCDICGTLVHNYRAEHHRNVHLDLKPYSCDVEGCEATFYSHRSSRLHNLSLHVHRDEIGKLYECDECHRMIKGKKNMLQHKRRLHSGKPINPFKRQCEVCGKYYYKSYLKDHIATHTGEQAHKCNLCDKKYAAYTNLLIHMQKQHTKKSGLK